MITGAFALFLHKHTLYNSPVFVLCPVDANGPNLLLQQCSATISGLAFDLLVQMDLTSCTARTMHCKMYCSATISGLAFALLVQMDLVLTSRTVYSRSSVQ